MKNTKQRNLVTDQNQNWTKGKTFKSWKQNLRHETEIEVTRQKLTYVIIPLFNFYSNPAWGRDTITGNRVRPGEVAQVPLSLRAVLSTSILLSKNIFLSFFCPWKGFRTHQFGIWHSGDYRHTEISKNGSSSQKSLLACGDAEKERSILIILMTFSCSIADLISDFQRQLNSFAFVNLDFDLLISVLNS